jgi:hypothetical protein
LTALGHELSLLKASLWLPTTTLSRYNLAP